MDLATRLPFQSTFVCHCNGMLIWNSPLSNIIGLLPFFQGDVHLADIFLPSIERVRSIFTNEPKPSLGLYCSSLLLAYDESKSKCVVRMVDFAHWRSASEANDPSGIVHGFNNLISLLSEIRSCQSPHYNAPFS